MANSHLNIFNHYSDSDSEIVIENNLTRALAISLQVDPLFREDFIRTIILDYNSISFDSETKIFFNIDVQIVTSTLEALPYIYPVSLTTELLSKLEYNNESVTSQSKQITDIVISLADRLVVIEVKRSNENCLRQLKAQINAIPGSDQSQIEFIPLTWAKIISLLEISIKKRLIAENSVPRITSDYFNFLSSKFPYWVEAKPLCKIPKITNENIVLIQKRIEKIKNLLGVELNSIGGRYSVPINWGAASEINIRISTEHNAVLVSVWPGDTKAQGWSVWGNEKWKRWINDKAMIIGDFRFDVCTTTYVKFSHFQQGIDWIWDIDISENINMFCMFKDICGRKKKPDWLHFDEVLSRYVLNWKSKCKWVNEFENSNRTYFDVSIGVEYTVRIPYEILSSLDKEENKGTEVIEILKLVMKAMEERIIA
jgi:hypothetical protein